MMLSAHMTVMGDAVYSSICFYGDKPPQLRMSVGDADLVLSVPIAGGIIDALHSIDHLAAAIGAWRSDVEDYYKEDEGEYAEDCSPG